MIPVLFSHSALVQGDFVQLPFVFTGASPDSYLAVPMLWCPQFHGVSLLLSAGSWGFFVYITSPQVLSPKSSLGNQDSHLKNPFHLEVLSSGPASVALRKWCAKWPTGLLYLRGRHPGSQILYRVCAPPSLPPNFRSIALSSLLSLIRNSPHGLRVMNWTLESPSS